MNARRLSASGASLIVHVCLAALVIWFPFEAARPSASGGDGSTAAVAVHPWERRRPKPDSAGDPDKDLLELDDVEVSDVVIQGFTFDTRKIARRVSSLFPFLTTSVELRRVFSTTSSSPGGAFASATMPRRSESGSESGNAPLLLGAAALQGLVDTSWSRRHRWDAFRPLVRLAEEHHPDTGELPLLFRTYLDQNLLQPYVDTTIRDPRLWTMLGIAADNADFVNFITSYEAQHPSTKTTTELLFLLDEIVQGNLEGLNTLLDSDPALHLQWTREVSPKAYDLAVAIRERYTSEIDRLGFASAHAIRTHYDNVRLGLLGNVLRTTPGGYRSGDANFLIGMIHWRQGKKDDAAAAWRSITEDRADSYVAVYSQLRDVLQDEVNPNAPLVAVRVDSILASETRRWADFSKRRLLQFGHAFDTF